MLGKSNFLIFTKFDPQIFLLNMYFSEVANSRINRYKVQGHRNLKQFPGLTSHDPKQKR